MGIGFKGNMLKEGQLGENSFTPMEIDSNVSIRMVRPMEKG